jgi:hypothetical protein
LVDKMILVTTIDDGLARTQASLSDP